MSSRRLAPFVVGLASGLVFALGLALSGMTDPAKVLAFLDFTGDWDPSLAFVMVGAIGVHFTWLRLSARRSAPAPADDGAVSAAAPRVDFPLLLGAGIFGVGWGLGGYCPGPALVALALGRGEALLFVAAMAAGVALFQAWGRLGERSLSAPEPL